MRMDVDESGRERESVGIYRTRRGAADFANFDNLSTVYRNVGVLTRSASPVNHHCILDDQVVCHILRPPPLSASNPNRKRNCGDHNKTARKKHLNSEMI